MTRGVGVRLTQESPQFIRENFETMTWLWQAFPFMTFLLGLAVGAALMYAPMALRLWKLRQRLAKTDSPNATRELRV